MNCNFNVHGQTKEIVIKKSKNLQSKSNNTAETKAAAAETYKI